MTEVTEEGQADKKADEEKRPEPPVETLYDDEGLRGEKATNPPPTKP